MTTLKLRATFMLLIVILAAIVISFNCCNHDVEGWKQGLAAKDSMIKYIQAQRMEDRQKIDSLNAINQLLEDSLHNKQTALTIKYEKIPIYINSLNKDSLRAHANQ